MDEYSSDDRNKQSGLTEAEARLRLAQSGRNIILTEQIRTVLHIAGDALREPTFLLLLAADGVYLGSLGEGLFAGAATSLGMVILQEARSERAPQALQTLAEPEASARIEVGASRR